MALAGMHHLMKMTYQYLFADTYLLSVFHQEYQAFRGSADEQKLRERLEKWASKSFQKETTSEIAFVNIFFDETWGYVQSGKASGSGYTCYPKFAIGGSGQGGGTGEADAALGYFNDPVVPPTPQVVCEFKDVRSNLDAPQKRKGNNRSPVKQCADYLREAMKPHFGNEAVLPTWAIVTDMNEFRLYWRNTIPTQYQRFIIKKATTDAGVSLLDDTEAGSFQRFLFQKLFHADTLLTTGGASLLQRLLKDQRFREKDIESKFYKEYSAYRQKLIELIIINNTAFSGTRGKLVRLAQKLIDRCIFIMFCEDMGEQLSFPPNALRDYLAELSKATTFEPSEFDAWNKLKELFTAMNDGTKFRSRNLNRFNGGLFAKDDALEALRIPNEAFCVTMQGENDTTLRSSPLTLLYFSGSYNFGTMKREGKAITLFTLGRIFEQSITELEALEAEAENRPSITKESKRKRDGVYYTPEWVVEKVVSETVGTRLDDIRRNLGWSFQLEGDEDAIKAQVDLSPSKRSQVFVRHVKAVEQFRVRLETFTVLDPACGSGAFLIHTLEYLLRERQRVEREFALVTGGKGAALFEFKSDEAVRSILSSNIFGVDINPASVEIARLALWLHTAKSNQPLTNLDSNIVTGNSLVGPEVYEFKKDLLSADETKRETINAFDFEATFQAVFNKSRPEGKGFDCVVGNPPYVKLQNFKKVYPETADFLRNATGKDDVPLYQSCQSGSYDLYLPFIEHGISLLNNAGRMGYIAPSVWRFNGYGKSLRAYIKQNRSLDRWIDFGSFQVFDEAITYTALQFYAKFPSESIQIAFAPDGALGDIPDWNDPEWRISYDQIPAADPWVFASQPTLKLLAKLKTNSLRLGDPAVTEAVSQGLVSGAFDIFANHQMQSGSYRSVVEKVANDVELEDAATLALINATDIDRFVIHPTKLRIIFPYKVTGDRVSLIPESSFSTKFPKAYAHLKTYEKKLRARDAGQFSDIPGANGNGGARAHEWYAYSRNQNLEKQSRPKIVIAGTATRIEAALDEKGVFATNDKRVYTIFPRKPDDVKFLVAILNSRVSTFVFKQYARPKAGGYYDIESQFLNPIPIPKASDKDKKRVSDLSDKLSKAHVANIELLDNISRRLAACTKITKAEEWLWPGKVASLKELRKKAPSTLGKREQAKWARTERERQIGIQNELLATQLRPDMKLEAGLTTEGELTIKSGEMTVLNGVFVSADEAEMILFSWNNILRRNPSLDSQHFARKLMDVRLTENNAIRQQLKGLDQKATQLATEIEGLETELDAIAYELFGLSVEEQKIVEAS
ncbi:Eco57I restriction-modification methylase domain-containing protein [Tianweitania sp. BSSL-BM11]|uniref:site-specific DNA-methyltransferase (adenine-specific) n=1 Tax=Tianweitania aestuarii TaxID=2814886 RepID=A0ABS5S206_9HYPH|nr:DNA methyltransferase [Tianweitania aestuarii]MBS9721947.1 Eco57I restriction-modification methylase domain-containing protein [Tianweitania aestuarii]